MTEGDALFAALAHEVKTPLAILRGYAELLANRDDEETRRTAPAAILEAAERLAPAVDDLLLALELESDALEVDRRPVDVGKLAGVTADSLPAVTGDPRLLGRALAILGSDNLAVSVADGRVTLAADAVRPSRLELYVARRIAELHGGELRETAAGVGLTLPLA